MSGDCLNKLCTYVFSGKFICEKVNGWFIAPFGSWLTFLTSLKWLYRQQKKQIEVFVTRVGNKRFTWSETLEFFLLKEVYKFSWSLRHKKVSCNFINRKKLFLNTWANSIAFETATRDHIESRRKLFPCLVLIAKFLGETLVHAR